MQKQGIDMELLEKLGAIVALEYIERQSDKYYDEAVQIFKERIAVSSHLMSGYILSSAAGLSLHTAIDNFNMFYEI